MIRGLGVASIIGLVLAMSPAGGAPAASSQTTSTSARFRVLDVYVDSSSRLAAYQLEVVVARGDSAIVGVEGGESPLHRAPYYDEAAFAKGRIVLAAFTTRGALAPGRHRVATLHVREGPSGASYRVVMKVAADSSGEKKPAAATVEPRRSRR